MNGATDQVTRDVDLHHVLWRTRGLNWDYTFLLRPILPDADRWYELHSRIFDGLAPETTEQDRMGTVLDGDDEHGFIAATFLDPSRRDAAGRPISHYVVLFLPNEPLKQEFDGVPENWGRQLVAALSPALDAAFGLPVSEAEPNGRTIDDVEDIVAAELSSMAEPIHIDGRKVAAARGPSVTIEKKKQSLAVVRSSLNPRLTILACTLLLVVVWLLLR